VFRNIAKIRLQSGISLVETMNAIVILSIGLIGISAYRYCSAMDAHKADTYAASARIGYLLSESWKGMQGSETYDPIARLGAGLPITASNGPEAPAGYTILGSYRIVLDDNVFYATLSWNDVNSGLRALNVVLTWAQSAEGQNDIDKADKSFELTTYVLN
jgi:Tfp pilus assembly protein PilV